MKKMACFSYRSLLALSGCALVLALAAGCAAPKGGVHTYNTGPHQTYIVTDGDTGTFPTPDLIVNLQNPDSNANKNGAPVHGCYRVLPGTDNTGPHQNPNIVINLLPNPGPAATTYPPRKLVIVTDDLADKEQNLDDPQLVILHLPAKLPFDNAGKLAQVEVCNKKAMNRSRRPH